MSRRGNPGRSGGGDAGGSSGGPKKSPLLNYDDLTEMVMARCMGRRVEGDVLEAEEAKKYQEARHDDKLLESLITKLVWTNFGKLDPSCFADSDPDFSVVAIASSSCPGCPEKKKGKSGKREKRRQRGSISSGLQDTAGNELPRVPVVAQALEDPDVASVAAAEEVVAPTEKIDGAAKKPAGTQSGKSKRSGKSRRGRK